MQVPDTYFLQQTIDRGLRAIDARLDRSQDFRPWFMLKLGDSPELVHDIWDLGDMCSRYVDAFILGRQATGCQVYVDAEQALLRQLHECDPYLEPFMAGRMLITYVSLFLRDRSPESSRRITDLIGVIRSHLTFEQDFAYYFKAPEGWTSISQPIFGSFLPCPTYPIGGIILALARYLEECEDPDAADLIDKLTTFVLRESGTFASDGSYLGHTHSGGILTAAVGIFRRAIYTGDKATTQLMKRTLDWTLTHCSSWGWVPDGLGGPDPSGETCSLTDALHFVLLAARHIDPGYYGVAERFARNQLIENQYREPGRALPVHDFPNKGAVARALEGSWASWSKPNSLDNGLDSVEGCCLGAGIRACCLALGHAVERTADAVRVNMLFSRSSEWAEVISYLPYMGRVDVRMRVDSALAVRIPDGVADEETSISGAETFFIRDGWFVFPGARQGDTISISFPLVTREADESVAGEDYGVKWRGDTVVDISPAGLRYPLFDRAWMEREEPPMLLDPPYRNQQDSPVLW